ncbi:MAG: hypothetical protein KAS90_05900 [Candidatus Aenigmarchaeota archaeon]|nr:hypothetical protein [Candidatus Aenigmarchaeota archaeon]
MVKKKIDKKDVLIGALVLILIVSCIFFYVQGKDEAEEEPPVIDVNEVTDGDGYEDNAASIQYNDGLHRVKFEHMIMFKGFMFLNEVNFMTEENESFVLMRTTPDMKPGDDVFEAYMVPVIEDGVMAVNIYLDDDFRAFMGDDTNIIWGSEYQNFKKYDFSVEYKPGIYVDTVYDNDTERFRIGGNDANVFVGDATLEDAQAMNMDGITGVFLK